MHTPKKKVIGIDLDDVLLDFNAALYLWHNAKHHTALEYEEITSYFLEDMWGCTREEVMAKIADFYQSHDHIQTGPVAGAVEAIQKLSLLHTLIVVTSKPEYLRPHTIAWLDKYFPNMFQSVHFTNHFLGDESRRREKSVVCQELGIEIFIEDAPTHALDVATVCETVFLIDRPWNQARVLPPIIRVSSWEEIVQKLQ
jgi:uncharacterized HAD superfamily protein